MSAITTQWVGTDRRSAREVLNEIAAADSSRIIISRTIPSTPDQVTQALPIPDDPSAILLLEPAPPDAPLEVTLTSDWPMGLSLLVAVPESFALIAVHELTSVRREAARTAQSLGEWAIGLWDNGAMPIRRPSGNGLSFPSIGTSPQGKLTPPFPPLPDAWRTAINRLAGLRLSHNDPDVTALKAGLFQWHDGLDESHECAQAIEGKGRHRAGDYWHAIMHRREPDYANSKYWFRHVGRHPIFPELGERAAPWIDAAAPEWRDKLLRGGWDPLAFVDFCEIAQRERNSRHTELAESIQNIEMLLLLASTYADASA